MRAVGNGDRELFEQDALEIDVILNNVSQSVKLQAKYYV